MPLKHRDGQHVERVEIEFLVLHDHLALAADDEIDLVVEMAMRAGQLPQGVIMLPPIGGAQPRKKTVIVKVDQAGHWLHHDQLELFLRETKSFLAANERE